MDKLTAQKLQNINKNFYENSAQSFSQTRQNPWAGWNKLALYLKLNLINPKSLLDLGCGNGRFFGFITKLYPSINYFGVDFSESLIKIAKNLFPNTTFKTMNLNNLENELNNKYDFITLFGVLHHVPSINARRDLLKTISKKLSDDGLLVFTRWNFIFDERLMSRKHKWEEVNISSHQVEENDYLLDWQANSKMLRYAHYTNDKEIQDLISFGDFKEINRFEADGKNDKLNTYILLKKSVLKINLELEAEKVMINQAFILD